MEILVQSVEGQLPSISVVICCHNSAARLPQTLRHLAEQQVSRELAWEIVVVDNASTDDTIAVAQRFAEERTTPLIRIVSEQQLGQAYARLRGLQETRSEIILFVDDDNWLDPQYIAIVAKTFHRHPEISALGGISTAVFEQEPPPWMARHQRWYAVSGPPHSMLQLTEVEFLWGAGTAFRRTALAQISNKPLHATGRQGTALQGGDDDELCCRLRLRGERLFCHPGLRFQHFLPARRVQWDYLCRLHYAAGETSVLLDAYRIPTTRKWPAWLLRSWYAQVCNAWWQLCKHPVVLWRHVSAMEGDDRVLRMESYKGRLAGLRRHRDDYRQIVSSEPHE